MKNNFNKRYLGLAIASVLAAPSYSSFVAAGQLEEVVVTAQKRDQTLQEVAGSISALASKQIELRGMQQVEDFFQAVPGVSYSQQSGSQLVTIRGIGLQVDTGIAEPGVASHIDGVFQARSTMAGLDLNDVERIEVLRGPQGTLYGRNATGGAINFISKKPAADFQGDLTFSAGSWNKKGVSTSLSGPLIDETLLGRVSLYASKNDGYIENLGDARDLGASEKRGIRGALRLNLSDELTFDFAAYHHRGEFDDIQQNLDLNQPSVISTMAQLGMLPGLISTDKPNTVVMNKPYPKGENRTTGATLTAEWNISNTVTLTSISGYVDHKQGPGYYTADSTNYGLVAIGTPEAPRISTSKTFSQEFSFSGSAMDDKLDWVAGLYFFEEDYQPGIPVGFAAPMNFFLGNSFGLPGLSVDALAQQQNEQTESIAEFVDLTYSLADTWRLNVGLRQSRDRKDIHQDLATVVSNPLGAPNPFGLPAGASLTMVTCPHTESRFDWESTSPKVRLEWDAGDSVMVYAQWQKGFKSGGINLSTCGQSFDPEEIVATEVGAKATLFDGALTINGAIYHYKYDGLQVLTFTPTGTDALVQNVPQAEVTGGEVESVWRATDVVSFDLGLAYSDSEITKSDAIFDTVAALNGVNPNIDPTGNPLPRNPRHTETLGVNLDWDTSVGGVGARAEVYHSAEIQYRLFNNKEDIGDAYTVGNVYVSWRNPSESLMVRTYVKNVTDEKYINQIIHALTTGKQGTYAQPRNAGVDVTFKF